MTYAFPVHRPKAPAGSTYSDSMVIDDGMTLRDYFAAKAMPALMADWKQAIRDSKALGVSPLEGVAITAYAFAEAMLEARNK